MLHFSGRAALMALILGPALALTGCANGPSAQARAVGAPNESLLEPAQRAMAHAAQNDWFARAPELMGAARMRLSTAQSIVYESARRNRDLTPDEKQRVNALVNAVKLDVRTARAKSALADTQQRARALEGNQRSEGGATGVGETQRKALRPGMTESKAIPSSEPGEQSGVSRESGPPALNAGPGVENKTERPLPPNSNIED